MIKKCCSCSRQSNHSINSNPIEPKKENCFTSICRRISYAYQRAVKRLVEFFWKRRWYTTGTVLGTILQEPLNSLKGGILMVLGRKKHFNFYNLNPRHLTKTQLQHRPLLLLHGNHHNQSAWLSLAKTLRAKYNGPVYTLNLPHGGFGVRDYDLVNQKIAEIKAQYQAHQLDVKVDIAGHSRGSGVASCIAVRTKGTDGQYYWGSHTDIGKIIKIATPLDQEEIDRMNHMDPSCLSRIYEINAQFDVLVSEPSLLKSQAYEVPTGHLGVIFSKMTHAHVVRILNQS